MSKLDPFSVEIAKMVRNMSDEAILALVRNQLGVVAAVSTLAPAAPLAAPAVPARGRRAAKRVVKRAARRVTPKTVVLAVKTAAATAVAKPTRKVAKKAVKKLARRARAVGAEAKQKALDLVERTVKASTGLAVSEIVAQTGLPASRVTSAVRELKGDKRIYQGGDRRFARYAGDPRTAKKASELARTTAKGPQRG
jgi:hypothetical protein